MYKTLHGMTSDYLRSRFVYCDNIKQLLDEVEHDIMNYFFPRGHGNESCNLIGS